MFFFFLDILVKCSTILIIFKSNLAIDNISHKYKPGLQPARAFDRKCPKKALRGRSARRAPKGPLGQRSPPRAARGWGTH